MEYIAVDLDGAEVNLTNLIIREHLSADICKHEHSPSSEEVYVYG